MAVRIAGRQVDKEVYREVSKQEGINGWKGGRCRQVNKHEDRKIRRLIKERYANIRVRAGNKADADK